MTRRLIPIAMLATAALAACEGADQGPGGLSAEESDALNEAAEMLDASPDRLVFEEAAEAGNGGEAQVPGSDAPAIDGAGE